MHARALESFRAARFPEAYGRFIDLANAGQPASARDALWMCQHGLPLFGKNWGCSQQDVSAWAGLSDAAPFDIRDIAGAGPRVAVPRRRD